MDDKKWTFRRLLKTIALMSLVFFGFLAVYGGIIFWQTQTIKNPKNCFVTAMYKVKLCPGSQSYVSYKAVPKYFFQALILSEDASFYSHKGFDWFEIKESFQRNFLEWRFARGGSTLTQQLAKNLYLTKEKSLSRKFKEFFIAKQIERKLTKTQILEKYINVVEFGRDTFGIKMASEKYFSKSPELLNLLESIYLVSLLPSPKRLGKSFDEKSLSKNNIWRMQVILKRLYRTNRINDDVYVYIQMLLENEGWPFLNFSNDLFNFDDGLSIEDELSIELEDSDFDDDEFKKADIEENSKETDIILNSESDTSLLEKINSEEPVVDEPDETTHQELVIDAPVEAKDDDSQEPVIDESEEGSP